MSILSNLHISIFADGADLDVIDMHSKNPLIKGFTTNPTLMYKSGIKDYKAFALDALSIVKDKPFSFEVFADDFESMKKQALEIASWSDNVNVKIPITNSKGQSCEELIVYLSKQKVKLNITAVFTQEQIEIAHRSLDPSVYSIISIFAGRIADTGVNPVPFFSNALKLINKKTSNTSLIWASPRELYNIIEADKVGCHIITVTDDLLKKLNLFGKDLKLFSLETVQMFYNDAEKSGFKINV